MNEDLLKAALKNAVSGKCFFLCGDEEYTKDHYVKQMLKRIESLPMPEFNLIRFSGKDFTPFALATALEELPYMSDYKLIIIEELDYGKLSDSVVSDIITALDTMPEYVNVLFVAKSNELSAKIIGKKEKAAISALIEFTEKNGIFTVFEKETGAKLKKWIKRHFDAANTEITESVPETMVNVCGEDMYTLKGEALKLISYCKGRTVTDDDVINVCCSNKSFRVFDLTKALTAGNTARVHDIYNFLINSGVSPYMLINMLSSCITDITVTKAGLEDGKSLAEIAKALKTFEWAVRNYAPYARKVSFDFLDYAADKCNECAVALKSYRNDPACTVEIFLLRLAAYEKN
ncbi:MAG: DNA polymerase III subunit delta [Clostridia bacterium]|nr:DNA polymerase III subunit delta [Clostridia bacterium]